MPRKRKRRAGQSLTSEKAAATGEVADSEKSMERPLLSLAFLADNPLDEILSFCSGFDLGRLSLTCPALRTSAERYAERESRSLVSSRGYVPGRCLDEFGFYCTPSVPLDWSWAGRLERLRSRDCMPGVDLFLYGHCFDTYQERSSAARELWDAAERYLFADPDVIEEIMEGSGSTISAKVGARNDGPVFAARLTKRTPSSKKLGFCRALINQTDVFGDLFLPSYGVAHPMVLDTREVLIVSTPGLSEGEENVARTFAIPPLAPLEPLVTFETHLVHKCWSCGEELKERGSACDSCVFRDQSFLPEKDKYQPFSSNTEAARSLAEMEGQEDDIEPVTLFELRSGIIRDSTVLGRAKVRYQNLDNEFGEKAGPTITRIESCHPAGSAPLHSKLLDAVMEWVEVMFPHPTELQVDHSVWQEQVPDGEELFHSRGWCNTNGEGDFEVVIGAQKEDSEDDTNRSSHGANGTDSDRSSSSSRSSSIVSSSSSSSSRDGDGDGDGDSSRNSDSDD